MRKNSSLFHRLPAGEYGLLTWYPNAKAPKEDEAPAKKGKAKKAKKTASEPSKKSAETKPKDSKQTVAQLVEGVMRGATTGFMKIPEIVAALEASGTPLKGTNPSTHVGSVLSRGKQFVSEKGKGWRLRTDADGPKETESQEV